MNPGKESFIKNRYFQNITLAMTAAGLFVYVALRAYFLSFTFDEIASFEQMKSFTLDYANDTANSHLLNMILMKWSFSIFGGSEFALRLPNVLAFAIYLASAIKINKSLRMPFAFSSLILLTCNPFVLDFFSLARGYGLSLGIMLSSIYFFVAYQSDKKFYKAIIAIILGGLALLASYTLMNYFIPLAFVIVIFIWLQPVPIRKKVLNSLIVFVLVMLCLASVFPILLDLKSQGQLYFGGRANIFSNTILSLGRCFGYMKSYSILAKYLFAFLFSVAILISLINVFFSIKKRTLDISGGISIIFVLSLLSPIAQQLLFKTIYPVERTAIFYYPLMILALFQWSAPWKLKGVRLAHLIILLLFSLHFILCINTDHTYSWRYDSGTKSVFRFLKNKTAANKIIGVDYVHMMSAMYYVNALNAPELQLKQVSECWEFPLGLEELNPYYYGTDEYCRTKPEVSVEKIISPEIDYYYLDQYFLDALRKSEVPFRVIQAYPYSRSALIEILR